jgi:hypothetical protein
LISVHTRQPVLTAGGRNPANTRQVPTGAVNWGRGGVHPDPARGDDLALQLNVGSNPRGIVAVIALGTAVLPTPVELPGFQGKFFLNPAAMYLLNPLTVPASGVVVLEFALRDAFLRTFLGANDLNAQALVVFVNYVVFSNLMRWQTDYTT